MSLPPGTTLGPYEIVSQLGSGGMGIVYQARDPRLKRTVAIKLLPPDLTRDETAKQRFLQEAQAASALDHPNICTIYDVGETNDGQLYLVMAHYEGETLKERIARGPLALNDAIDIATQVGEGLAEAHRAGIVHRDIKPANLFVSKTGAVKILDFGLAKLAGSEGVTQTGTTVGTVAYMSPEQAKGWEVDHRTDIWSLGVVLYEMLAGKPPFQGENLLSLADAIRGSEPQALAGSSASVQPLVGKALAKDQEQRYQAVAELLHALRTGSTPTPVGSPKPEPDVPSIAVLPFDDMSPQKDQDYFCEGMAEEIINALTKLENLRVVARTSAFQFKGQALDLREIGRKLDVTSVLEGSVRKSGNRLRVTAQLINVGDGYHLWSERFDRPMDDVFEVQDEITQAVVEELKLKLLGEGVKPSVERPTDNLEAYHLVLKGRYYTERQSGEASQKALECFTQAVALEPGYAQAHAGIALANAQGAILGTGPSRQLMPVAKEAAWKALAIDESIADAHAALAFVLNHYEWDWPAAEREYRRALDLNPGHTAARSYFAVLLGEEGRGGESVVQAKAAVERDPLSLFARHVLALVLYLARQYEAAMTEARAGTELDRGYHLFYWHIGLPLVGLGRHEEAVETLRTATTLAPHDFFSKAYLGWALGLAGHKREAMGVLEELKLGRSRDHVSGFFLAAVCVGLDDYDQAISWLEEAADERYGWFPAINTLLVFDPLRSDSRFQALLGKMNIPAADVAPEQLVVPRRTSGEATAVGPTSTNVPSIAVLPFRNMSADPEQEYVCEGMAEELIDALAKLDGLRVVARTSAFQFKGQSPDLREVGDKLNVKTVLEGSVRKVGNRLRVNAQLINAEDGYHLWSERYDREAGDVFAVQDEITKSVIEKLRGKLLGTSDAPAVKQPTENLEAYNLVLKGRYHQIRMTRPSLERSLECFNQALVVEPDYAQAYGGIAMTNTIRGALSLGRPRDLMPDAKQAALRGLRIDETVADAHIGLGMVLHWYEWDWARAAREYRRGLELKPGDTLARGQYAMLLGQQGRVEESIAEARHAADRDPLAVMGHHNLSLALVMARRFDEAATAARAGLELEPSVWQFHHDLGWALIGLSQYEGAVEAFTQATVAAPGDPVHSAYLAWALGLDGRTPDALAILDELEQRREQQYVGGWMLAHIYLGLGDYERAVAWLLKAAEERDGIMTFVNQMSSVDPLRSDPRFQALLKKMNFPQAATDPPSSGA